MRIVIEPPLSLFLFPWVYTAKPSSLLVVPFHEKEGNGGRMESEDR